MRVLQPRAVAFRGRPRETRATLERILFALTTSEREMLFPSFDASSMTGVQCEWTETETLLSAKQWHQLLKRFHPTILVSFWNTPLLPVDSFADDAYPLRYVCHTGGSVKQVVPRVFLQEGGTVTNWGNLISHTVAEHALLLILASLRNLPQWYPASKASFTNAWGDGQKLGTRSLRGRKVGIHGFGNIARELVLLLKPFGVKCMAFSEGVPPEHMVSRGVAPCRGLDELFSQNEIIVECEALTRMTVGSVTKRHLELMPVDGVFVNVARGSIVDEAAMADLAAAGRIRVASDVFQVEPVPQASPLREIPGVIMSPHIGGPTSDWYPRCGDFALNNIRRYLAGSPLEGLVTLEIYDRST